MIRKTFFILMVIFGLISLYLIQEMCFLLGPQGISSLILNNHANESLDSSSLDMVRLEKLSSIPIVGEFFLQKKIKMHIRDREWGNVLTQCSKRNQLILRSESQKLLMYRAIAQFATLQFKKCRETIKELEQKAPHLLEKISELNYKINKKSKFFNKQVNESVQSGISQL